MKYYDLQVNGYAGVDFNRDGITSEDVVRACQQLAADGVEGILATIITDQLDAMCNRLRRLVTFRQHPAVKSVIHGFHIEGPFLSEKPGFIGAHPVDAASDADADAMARLLEAADGLTRIVTMAPERDPNFAVTRMLANQGVTVSAGHCDPTWDQLRGAIDAGLSMFTHLGNACPLQVHRHDNIIQRVLSLAEHLWVGFIADGVHVPFVALNNYLKCVGFDRALVVTDAIAAAGLGAGTFTLGDQTVVVDESLATWAEDRSHLMGAASTMPRVESNLRKSLQLTDDQTQRLLYGNPRRAIGADE